MRCRVMLIGALCLAAQLMSLSAPAQNGNNKKPSKKDGGAKKTAQWLNHGSKNVNHYFNGTSKKINKGSNQGSKKINHVFQGKK